MHHPHAETDEATIQACAVGWMVRVRSGEKEQVFRCATHEQAEKLMAVFQTRRPTRPERPAATPRQNLWRKTFGGARG